MLSFHLQDVALKFIIPSKTTEHFSYIQFKVGFRPVWREDVEGWRLLACLEGLLQWDGQRLAVKQLLVLNSGAPESLPHGDVLKRH